MENYIWVDYSLMAKHIWIWTEFRWTTLIHSAFWAAICEVTSLHIFFTEDPH